MDFLTIPGCLEEKDPGLPLAFVNSGVVLQSIYCILLHYHRTLCGTLPEQHICHLGESGSRA